MITPEIGFAGIRIQMLVERQFMESSTHSVTGAGQDQENKQQTWQAEKSTAGRPTGKNAATVAALGKLKDVLKGEAAS